MARNTQGNLALDMGVAPARQPQRRGADVRVIRPAHNTQTVQQPSLLVTAAKMMAVFIVVVCALSFVRIILTNQAVTTMIESDTLSAQITDARAEGVTLEMEQSVLSNPSAIKDQAKKLSMKAPEEVSTISLAPDVVAIENGKKLSLSGTIKNVIDLQE